MGLNSYAGWARRFLVISHIFPRIALDRKQNIYLYISTGNKHFTLHQAFIKKHLEKPSSNTYFPVGTRSKTSFVKSGTAVDTQQMSEIQSRLVVKRKIIESICLINQIICEMHLILDSHIWSKGLTHFWPCPPNNY